MLRSTALGLAVLAGAASGLSITCDAEYGKLCPSTPGEASKVAECLKALPSKEGIGLGCSAWMAVVSACDEELAAGGVCSDASMPDAFLCLSAWKSSQISGDCKVTVDTWAGRASSGGGGGGSAKPRKRKKSRAKQKRAAYKQAVKEAAERKKAEARKKKKGGKKGKRGKTGRRSKKKREL
jgi:hypothetical protein